MLGEHCCFFLLCSLIGVTASIVAGRYCGIVLLALLVTVASAAPYASNGLLTLESNSTLEVIALHQTSVGPV